MFDDEYGAGSNKLGAEHGGRYVGEALHVVGRVGKNDSVAAWRAADEAQGIASYKVEIVGPERLCNFCYETLLYGGLFHRSHVSASAREQLEAHRSGSGEKVEGIDIFEIGVVVQHVENILTCKIGGGACSDVGGHVEAPTAVFSSNYSHNGSIMSGKGALKASMPALMAAEGKMSGSA